MNYIFTGALIVLFCLLAFFIRPSWQAPLKVDSKDYIIPLPKAKSVINEVLLNVICVESPTLPVTIT